MTTTECIVCFGAVATGEPPPLSSEAAVAAAGDNASPLGNVTPEVSPEYVATPVQDIHTSDSAVAVLPSCGHYLHNQCLKQWIEVSNTCALCRQPFNVVNVKAYVSGPVIDTYVVQDKKQVPDIDPFAWADHGLAEAPIFSDGSLGTCMVCEDALFEEQSIFCDGCQACYHTYCVDEDSVPAGTWYCHQCHEDGTALASGRRSNVQRNRGRSLFQRLRGRSRPLERSLPRQRSLSPYTAVSTRIHGSINFDLDNPWADDDEQGSADPEIRRWTQRLRIAERQGAGHHFRDTARSYLDRRNERPRTPQPAPEASIEEREWMTFDRARASQADSDQAATRRQKRKSASASPADPQGPPREYKRAKTGPHVPSAPVSAAGPSGSRTSSASLVQPGALPSASAQEPGLLQDLLREISTSSHLSDRRQRPSVTVSTSNAPATTLSGAHSPVSSPAASNHSSPRYQPPSPPHSHASRPGSPTPLSTRIEPAYAMQSQPFSPVSPRFRSHQSHTRPGLGAENAPRSQNRAGRHQVAPALSTPADGTQQPPVCSRTRSEKRTEGSSARANLTLDAKSEIQNMVQTALKPPYRNSAIDAEQFTAINRSVSRRLYERIGEEGGVKEATRCKWEGVAKVEVEEAIRTITEARSTDPAAASPNPGAAAASE